MTDRWAAGHGPPVSAPHLAGAPAPDIAPAFAAAYREHHAFVYRVLRHLGVPPVHVDDRVQDVFLVVYRRWDALDPGVSLRSWLYGVARRVAATQHRGERRMQRRLAAVVAPTEGPGPEQLLAQAQAGDFVDQFLAGLDPERREIFVLAEVEHMSAPEIAAATGVKLNTVYSRLRAARDLFTRAVERRIRAEERDHARRG